MSWARGARGYMTTKLIWYSGWDSGIEKEHLVKIKEVGINSSSNIYFLLILFSNWPLYNLVSNNTGWICFKEMLTKRFWVVVHWSEWESVNYAFCPVTYCGILDETFSHLFRS